MSRNPLRPHDPVYALRSAESDAAARIPYVAGHSATLSPNMLKSPDKGGTSTAPLNNADTGETAPPNRAVPRAKDPVACAEVGDMSNDEIIFVTEAVRLATGAHPFAAIRMLARSIVLLQRHAHEPQDIDPRVEAVIDRRGYAPAVVVPSPVADVLTITGVDLPNPSVAAPTGRAVMEMVKWLNDRADMQPVRSEGYRNAAAMLTALGDEVWRLSRLPTQTDNGEPYFDQLAFEIPDDWASQGYISRLHEVADMAAVGRSLVGVIAEITRPGGEACEGLKGWMPADSPIEIVSDLLHFIHARDAEIIELQGMLEEATPVARFVADLAAMSDADCALNGSLMKVRDQARSKCDFPWPKFYSEEDRNRAVDALEAAIAANAQPPGGTRRFYQGATVDVIAEALGLTRAGQ